MRRTWTFIFVLIALLASGCARKGTDLVDDTVDLVERAVALLETHKDQPPEAVEAFRTFLDQNEAELRRLEQSAAKLTRDLSSEDRIALRRRFLERMKELNSRLKAVARSYKKHPEVLAGLDEVVKAPVP
jgi:hypothetical protein